MSKPNVCLYFDDFRGVGRLPDADRGKLFSAILAFSEFGEEPDFGEAALLGFAWDSIKPKLVADDERYKENSEKKRYATYCRDIRKTGTEPMPFDEWRGSADNSRYQAVSGDISRHPYSYTASSSSSFPSSSSVSSPSSEAVSDSVISPAAALLQQYGIMGDNELRETVEGDLKRHGKEIVNEALKRAKKDDLKSGVTTKFYVKCLLTVLKDYKREPSPAQQGYMTRQHSPSYFNDLDTNLDDCDDEGYLPGER